MGSNESEAKAPPSSSLSENPVIVMFPPTILIDDSSEILTVPTKLILPVLLNMVTKSPTLKSPNSLVPEV